MRNGASVGKSATVSSPASDRSIVPSATARLAMILAVLDRRVGMSGLRNADVHAATVGGVRLTEPAADLALALAIASATQDRALVSGTVSFGEVGLAGEVRPVVGAGRRLSEAYRLGFTHAIVPPGTVGNDARGVSNEAVSIAPAWPDNPTRSGRCRLHFADESTRSDE